MTETWEDLGGQPSTVQPPDMLRGCGNPCTLTRYAHADNHICPWREVGDKVYACGCQHPKPEKKGKK